MGDAPDVGPLDADANVEVDVTDALTPTDISDASDAADASTAIDSPNAADTTDVLPSDALDVTLTTDTSDVSTVVDVADATTVADVSGDIAADAAPLPLTLRGEFVGSALQGSGGSLTLAGRFHWGATLSGNSGTIRLDGVLR